MRRYLDLKYINQNCGEFFIRNDTKNIEPYLDILFTCKLEEQHVRNLMNLFLDNG